jgi:LEA14-like dessication related protein
VRNPNPEDLLIERFEYELILNGHRLGRGYVADPVSLRGFGEERVSSDFNLNFLNVPGTVKTIRDRDRVRAQARGHFYVREGGGFKKIGFDSDAEVDLRK